MISDEQIRNLLDRAFCPACEEVMGSCSPFVTEVKEDGAVDIRVSCAQCDADLIFTQERLEELAKAPEHAVFNGKRLNPGSFVLDGSLEDGFYARRYSADHHILHCGQREYRVFECREDAEQAAEDYWRDLAENDPKEFTCLVGEDVLIAWGLEQEAGPGDETACSLEEWLTEVVRNNPEECFASYDGEECDIDAIAEDLVDDLGFVPTIAYRTN